MLPSRAPVGVEEVTVVLPQRYRARVLGVAAEEDGAVLLLVQDMERKEDTLTPVWRLYRYGAPATFAAEVCRFTRPAEESGPVHMARCEGGLYLLFESRLMRVDLQARSVEGVCRIQLVSRDDGEPGAVKSMAIHDDVLALCVERAEEELSLHWIPLGDGPSAHVRFSGSRGERIAFGPDGILYTLDLLELGLWRHGKQLASHDLTGELTDWYRSPSELLAVTEDGRVLVGCGDKVITLGPDFTPVEILHLPGSGHGLTPIPGSSNVLSWRVDDVSATLVLQTFSP